MSAKVLTQNATLTHFIKDHLAGRRKMSMQGLVSDSHRPGAPAVAHTGNETPVTSMEGLYDATTLCVLDKECTNQIIMSIGICPWWTVGLLCFWLFAHKRLRVMFAASHPKGMCKGFICCQSINNERLIIR